MTQYGHGIDLEVEFVAKHATSKTSPDDWKVLDPVIANFSGKTNLASMKRDESSEVPQKTLILANEVTGGNTAI